MTCNATDAYRTCVVLVVEDDPPVRLLLHLLLEEAGYKVVAAADGMEAINLSRTARPQAVILDLDLPIMRGEEVAVELQARFGTGLPIIVVSGAHDGRRRSEQIRPSTFLGKPFEIETLLDVVAQLTA
jgi:DNA-binding response OmpR family regulator